MKEILQQINNKTLQISENVCTSNLVQNLNCSKLTSKKALTDAKVGLEVVPLESTNPIRMIYGILRFGMVWYENHLHSGNLT